MNDSIFTKIVKGEIPCHKLYEDELTMAFLDIHPLTPGHALVIPKKQVEFVWDLEQEDYQAVMRTVQLIALQLRSVMGTRYVSSRVVGVDVPHAHVQLIPFDSPEELAREQDMMTEPDHLALGDLAKKLQVVI